MPPISASGLSLANHSAKPSAVTSSRYAARAPASSGPVTAANARCRRRRRPDPAQGPAEATSTAAVTCSRCRWPMTGCPYRAKITSPCSVTLNRPSTDAWRLGKDRAPGRAAAAAERAAAAVEQHEPDAVARRPARQALLHVEQPQRGADHAQLLGGVGVAEHHLQAPPGAGQPARDRLKRDDRRRARRRRAPGRRRSRTAGPRRAPAARPGRHSPASSCTAAMSSAEVVKLTT